VNHRLQHFLTTFIITCFVTNKADGNVFLKIEFIKAQLRHIFWSGVSSHKIKFLLHLVGRLSFDNDGTSAVKFVF